MQATFTKAAELGHTACRDTLKGWLFRVAMNEALAIPRRQSRTDRVLERVAWGLVREVDRPDDPVFRRETIDSVRAALDALPAEQRQVVCLRIYDEKKFETIARELGLPLGTVLSRMQLALKKLRIRLEERR